MFLFIIHLENLIDLKGVFQAVFELNLSLKSIKNFFEEIEGVHLKFVSKGL